MNPEQTFSIGSQQVAELRGRLSQRQLLDSDWDLLEGLLCFLFRILESAEQMRLSLRRLENLLFGKKSEKSRRNQPETQLGDEQGPSSGSPTVSRTETADSDSARSPDLSRPEKNRPSGHGRLGADAYPQAETIACPHPELGPGQACPQCHKGTLYLLRHPSVEIRIVGQAPLSARRYERDRLRCSACGGPDGSLAAGGRNRQV